MVKFIRFTDYADVSLEAVPDFFWSGLPITTGKSVFLKPNLVSPETCWDANSTTRVEITELVIQKLIRDKAARIIVGECGFKNQWQNTIQSTRYDRLLQKYDIELIPLQDGPNFHKFTLQRIPKGEYLSLFGVKFSDYMTECDMVINIPKMKVHNMAKMTCAIKNMMGTMAQKGSMHPRANTAILHKRLADLYTLTSKFVDFIVVDAIIGQEFSEQCGHPVKSNVILSGTDQWEIDATAAMLMGFHPDSVPYLTNINPDFSRIDVPPRLIKPYELPLRWRK